VTVIDPFFVFFPSCCNHEPIWFCEENVFAWTSSLSMISTISLAFPWKDLGLVFHAACLKHQGSGKSWFQFFRFRHISCLEIIVEPNYLRIRTGILPVKSHETWKEVWFSRGILTWRPLKFAVPKLPLNTRISPAHKSFLRTRLASPRLLSCLCSNVYFVF